LQNEEAQRRILKQVMIVTPFLLTDLSSLHEQLPQRIQRTDLLHLQLKGWRIRQDVQKLLRDHCTPWIQTQLHPWFRWWAPQSTAS